MKRLLAALVAASVVATSAAYAAPYHPPMVTHHVQPQKVPYWKKGQHLSRHDHWSAVNDYRRYHLRQPPRGQHWVRVGNQYLLVGILTGLISDAIAAR